MIINDINEINQLLKDKTIKEVVQDADGVKIIFTDKSTFKIKTFQYQIEIE